MAALDLYQGEFLAGVSVSDAPEFDEWLTLQRERLRLALAQALQAALKGYVQNGPAAASPAAGIALARRLLELDPWNEDAHRALMALLARDGQRGAALSHYAACRRVLADELGVDPSPETAALAARLRAAPVAVPHNLPARAAGFVGREAELALVAGRLADPACRLVTLVGLGGSGKTALAIEAARRFVAPEAGLGEPVFPDGVFLVPLAEAAPSATDAPEAARAQEPDTAEHAAARVGAAIGRALERLSEKGLGRRSPRTDLRAGHAGSGDGGAVDRLAAVAGRLRSKRVLLVVDGMDGLTTGAGALATLLQQAAGVTLLVTARTRLRLSGETVCDVRGLRVPAGAADLERSDAGQLFLEEAARVRPEAPLGRAERAAAAEVCRLLDGHPLALLHAAGGLRGVTCADLAADLAAGRELPGRRRRRAASPRARPACGRCWTAPGHSSPTPSAPCCAGWPRSAAPSRGTRPPPPAPGRPSCWGSSTPACWVASRGAATPSTRWCSGTRPPPARPRRPQPRSPRERSPRPLRPETGRPALPAQQPLRRRLAWPAVPRWVRGCRGSGGRSACWRRPSRAPQPPPGCPAPDVAPSATGAAERGGRPPGGAPSRTCRTRARAASLAVRAVRAGAGSPGRCVVAAATGRSAPAPPERQAGAPHAPPAPPIERVRRRLRRQPGPRSQAQLRQERRGAPQTCRRPPGAARGVLTCGVRLDAVTRRPVHPPCRPVPGASTHTQGRTGHVSRSGHAPRRSTGAGPRRRTARGIPGGDGRGVGEPLPGAGAPGGLRRRPGVRRLVLRSYVFSIAAVGLLGFALGYALATGLLMAFGLDFGLVVSLVGSFAGLAVGAGVVLLNVQKYVVVGATALLGAGVIVGTFLSLFGGLPPAELTQNPVRHALQTSPFWLLVFQAVAALGAGAQVVSTRRWEVDTYNRWAGLSEPDPTPAGNPVASS